MRIVGMRKTEVIEKYPLLKEYRKDANFVTKAYHVIIDKITQGLEIESCKVLAKEKLDFTLVNALSVIEEFKNGSRVLTNKLDNAIGIVELALEDFKKYFYTEPIRQKTSRTLMFLSRIEKAKKEELSRTIWLMTGFYVYPETWVQLVNEIVADKIVYCTLQYREKKKLQSIRVKLSDYLSYKNIVIDYRIIPEDKEKEIIDIVNFHFGFFKITSVFATEINGDRLIIYPTRNRKEKVEMNLFEFEDYEQLLGV